METWYALLLFTLPIPWIAKLIWPHKIKWPELAATAAINFILVSGLYFAGTAGMTSDREIWNGEITSKTRSHGHYLRPYPCNCRTVCSGSGQNQTCSTHCDTCYEDRYTVNWSAQSTIGEFTLEHLDRGSKSVYKTPDPARYTSTQVGDPCSREHAFTNYIKAVPESLFHANPTLMQQFAGMVPEYPGKIYDFYNIDRVLSVGVPVPQMATWNRELAKTLRKLGPAKQANAIIVFVKTNDPGYIHALERAWLGGKKNDIIVVIGSTSYPKIDWVNVSSWSKAELFKVQLRDDILALGEIKRTEILQLVDKHTTAGYIRRNMSDFEYLKDEIEPPMWLTILAALVGILFSLGASFFFYREDPFNSTLPRYYR